VEQGQVVAEIVNPLADDPAAARMAMRAATAGVVISRCIKKLAAPGDGILMIVGQQALAYRQVKLMSD
jgi:predicted deacylase